MKKVAYVVLILTIVGIADTIYLISKQLSGIEIGTCPIFGTGCGDVLHSVYSKFLGVPLSYYGFAFYAGMATLASLTIFKPSKRAEDLLALGGVTGFLLSVYFIYVQAVLIGAFCFYCVISAVTSTLLFFTLLPTIINKILDFKSKPAQEITTDEDEKLPD